MENASEEIHTNLSKMVEFSLLDRNGTEVQLVASEADPIQLFIPRDEDAIRSALVWENVTAANKTNRIWDFHAVNITKGPNVTVAIHFEVHPLTLPTAYWIIYRFEDFPSRSSTVNQTDGEKLFCPTGMSFILHSIQDLFFLLSSFRRSQ